MRPCLATLALSAAATAAFAVQDGSYVDIRANGGLVGGKGYGGGITVMGAAIATGYGQRNAPYADAGIALGVRATVARIKADDATGTSTDVDLTGGQLLGGFCFRFGRSFNVEMLASIGKGFASDRMPVTNRDDGDYTRIGGEFGWYYTDRQSGLQAGVITGWSQHQVKATIGTATIDDKVGGIDLALSLGYRF